MTVLQQLKEEGIVARRFEDEDGLVLVADFGRSTDAAVDVVDETVIVVAGDDHHEFDVGADARAFMNNSVLTIEVNA
jgi:hypothetical protein